MRHLEAPAPPPSLPTDLAPGSYNPNERGDHTHLLTCNPQPGDDRTTKSQKPFCTWFCAWCTWQPPTRGVVRMWAKGRRLTGKRNKAHHVQNFHCGTQCEDPREASKRPSLSQPGSIPFQKNVALSSHEERTGCATETAPTAPFSVGGPVRTPEAPLAERFSSWRWTSETCRGSWARASAGRAVGPSSRYRRAVGGGPRRPRP